MVGESEEMTHARAVGNRAPTVLEILPHSLRSFIAHPAVGRERIAADWNATGAIYLHRQSYRRIHVLKEGTL
jgi:hypothetical protein